MINDKFGRLLKGAINNIANYVGKTALVVEEELGQQIGLSTASIQRYRAGHIPPELTTEQTLAETVLKRGYLNRDWLQNFLQTARYPAPEKVAERLWPGHSTQPQPHHIYHHLPAPTYCQFVMRQQAYTDVIDGLRQRPAVVLSLGGMGKTRLAREVATQCLQIGNDAPDFDAVVWVSDKDWLGTTTLNTVLDEIARTLDYPGFTSLELEEKRREVEQLLRRQRVLLVVDNFETINDIILLMWLLRLPEPNKTLITTREYRREFQRASWPVELGRMSEKEAHNELMQLEALPASKFVETLA